MFDRIEKLGQSLVQHGPSNDRAYLMKLDPADLPELVKELAELCARHGYSKSFAKVPASAVEPFAAAGYREEARVPMMLGGSDAVFLGLYLDEQRALERQAERVAEVLAVARAKANTSPGAGSHAVVEETSASDADAMAEVYREVFASYPFPIHEPDYLTETMNSHVRYFCVREHGRIVALSSAEMDRSSGSVEMTDFATRPPARGRGLAVRLLAHMETAMRAQGDMETSFTIARSLSAGMNVTFARAGYTYAGTLTNNTNISGCIESMNVWYKALGGKKQ
jgi:putative beta-lysine N-acetyltransferase